jgi:hypothetical protein
MSLAPRQIELQQVRQLFGLQFSVEPVLLQAREELPFKYFAGVRVLLNNGFLELRPPQGLPHCCDILLRLTQYPI